MTGAPPAAAMRRQYTSPAARTRSTCPRWDRRALRCALQNPLHPVGREPGDDLSGLQILAVAVADDEHPFHTGTGDGRAIAPSLGAMASSTRSATPGGVL